MSVKDNLQIVQENIINIKKNIGRENDEINLLAVSKTKPLELLLEAYNSGQRLFGENRISEAEIKIPAMPEDAVFHMIGHLQGNKIRKACQLFHCIESVDSLKVAKRIDNCCRDSGKKMDVYLEINIANEDSKSGFILNDEFYNDFTEIICLENIEVIGLMCIGAHVTDENEVLKSFKALKELSENLIAMFPDFNGDKLSMGMSGDYKLAIEAGSTQVRIGSTIFGSRVK